MDMVRSSRKVVTYTRDSTSRVTGITTKDNSSATAEPVASEVAYLPFYPAGLFADGASTPGLDMPHLDGLALLLNYDADGRLIRDFNRGRCNEPDG